MYAIVEIAGKQFKVEANKYIYTNRLNNDAGSSVTFDKVMLVDNSGKISVGLPSIKGASVTGKVLEHVKDDKIIVFKKKRRKGYKKKNGHRTFLSKVLIESINA
jgi:large subunit ribosomal protein L21